MPYRRLPNTDAARLRALSAAKKAVEKYGYNNVPFNTKILNEINVFIPNFDRALVDYKNELNAQIEKSQTHYDNVRKLRMYLSHFIQVLNLACIRNDIRPEKKLLYKLLPNNQSIPDLSTEPLLLEWGHNIIEGEMERVRQNAGTPIYNPPIARVKVHYDRFKESVYKKSIKSKTKNSFLGSVQGMRDKADSLILDLWNQIEASFEHLGQAQTQEKSKEFGVIYYYRRNERERMANNSDTTATQDMPASE